jgi:AcrR family transcriptional regulator
MTQARGENFEGQREAILTSAAELFALRGYHGTSMNDVADACRLSKATLYHYYVDKSELLGNIAERHVSALVQLCELVRNDATIPPAKQLEALISRFLNEYAEAQNFHRVLTEDVRFLPRRARDRILDKERQVVQAFADAVAFVRPDVKRAALEKPIAMLLFGMLNWMFTWLRPKGRLTHASVAPLVCDLFLNGLNGLSALPAKRERRPAVRSAAAK